MSFGNENGNQETPKSKIDIINMKMKRADEIQIEIDNLVDRMPEGELKQELQSKTKELHELWAEVTELISKEDERDIKKLE
ncbi:hypothetical protein COY54_00585 [Candidatus Falkowbacteria bacterium CG_4_10_14_0_8_um_filter_41_36]|uniref:Uncharacterized protein n=2 Tax=Candidatus Falkowiibacteriota TaxID=1752728 RepID=A0A2G9ZP97_9BACT|nr:MAG: hypothetical protein COX21_00025 [Candidatus Falkowbacteria bacterium CG23_combo_of_CG06-09_8_20_14_all_41_10]PIZ11345.1 MAG: hypothetical protein COY54_00585 [Candidatus Falkowbacteria bacterium CG_4_10_14_0_8_um_filter_41_36]